MKKPGQDDFYDVDDFNDNFDIIDEVIPDQATSDEASIGENNTKYMTPLLVKQSVQPIDDMAVPVKSNRAPTSNDAHIAGKLWVIPKMTFNNLMPDALAQDPDNWDGSNCIMTANEKDIIATGDGTATSITAQAELLTEVFATDIIYVGCKLTAIDDANMFKAELLCGDNIITQHTILTPTSGDNEVFIARVPCGYIGSLTLKITSTYNTASAQSAKGIKLSNITVWNLTHDMCENFDNIEFTEDQATGYISEYGMFQSREYELGEDWWICRGMLDGEYSWQSYRDYTDQVIDNYNENYQNDKATSADATAGTSDTKWMTPARVKQVVDAAKTTVPITRGGTGATTVASARTNLGVPPISHAVNTATYGKGSAAVFGHVKLSDAVGGDNNAASGIAASEYSVGFVARLLKGLDAFTWTELANMGNDISAYFKIGDKKKVTLTDGEVVYLVLADFHHDNLTSGGTANATFILENCMNTNKMNNSSTNVGGWNGSYMRSTVIPAIYNKLPTDLKSAIKAVNKVTTNGNQSTAVQTTSDSIWLLSCIEVGTVTTGAGYVSEGSQYPIFTGNNSRVKLVGSSAYDWWLRSPYTNNATYFHDVSDNGSNGNNYANNTYGVVFGLCI